MGLEVVVVVDSVGIFVGVAGRRVGGRSLGIGGGEDDQAEGVGPQVADGDAAFGGHGGLGA